MPQLGYRVTLSNKGSAAQTKASQPGNHSMSGSMGLLHGLGTGKMKRNGGIEAGSVLDILGFNVVVGRGDLSGA
jgi:hypothetical protein